MHGVQHKLGGYSSATQNTARENLRTRASFRMGSPYIAECRSSQIGLALCAVYSLPLLIERLRRRVQALHRFARVHFAAGVRLRCCSLLPRELARLNTYIVARARALSARRGLVDLIRFRGRFT